MPSTVCAAVDVLLCTGFVKHILRNNLTYKRLQVQDISLHISNRLLGGQVRSADG